MVDNNDTICVTYKTNEPDLSIFLRKFNHGFHEFIDPKSKEGVCG